MQFLKKWHWECFSPIAGLFFTLSFAPFNYWYLIIVSLFYVFCSWLDCSATKSALRAYLFGLGLFGSGISWVYISAHYYGGASPIGAFLLTVLVVCFWAICPALTAYLSTKIAGTKHKHNLIWVIPFVWIFVEYIRGYWFLNGFPWLQIAYSQLHTPLQGYIPIIGAYGVGFILAISVSSIIAGYKQIISKGLCLGIILLMWCIGAFLQTISWTTPRGAAMTVALIQGNVAQDQKWLPENRIKTLSSYQQLTAQNWGVDLIVWPETAIPAFLSQVKKYYLDPLSQQAEANNSDLIVSLTARGKENDLYNSVLTLGSHEARYNKNHLLPFGEYLPLQPLSGFILNALNIHLGDFTSGGDQQKLLQAGGYPFATSICYEDAFAEEARRSMPEAAYLVNVTNDAWFGDSLEPHQHMQIAQMRALETGRYMLRATNTGVTAIVAPDGKIVSTAPMFEQTVLKGEIIPMAGMTPYAYLGDHIIVGLLFFCFLGLFFINKLSK